MPSTERCVERSMPHHQVRLLMKHDSSITMDKGQHLSLNAPLPKTLNILKLVVQHQRGINASTCYMQVSWQRHEMYFKACCYNMFSERRSPKRSKKEHPEARAAKESWVPSIVSATRGRTSTFFASARIASDVHVVFCFSHMGSVRTMSAPATRWDANVVVVLVVVVVVLGVVLGSGLVVVPTVWKAATASSKPATSCM